MTAKRAAIFKPIGIDLSHQLDVALGGKAQLLGNEDPLLVEQPPKSIEKIASKIIPCQKSGRPAALLIFADHAKDIGGLEDYARLMYSKIVELDVPTWVIAPSEGTGKNAAANILKVHPKREPVCKLTQQQIQSNVRAHNRG
jgi:hypothetical protein